LDDAALTSLLTYTRDRLDTYTNWEGSVEIRPPPLNPERAIFASRALPEPASSVLTIAFIDLSVFASDETRSEVPQLCYPNDEDTIVLLRERHSEFVDSLLSLSRNFGRRRALAKVGRPCCSFEVFAANHIHVNATTKGRSALSIITATGAALETARSRETSAPKDPTRKGKGTLQHVSCSSCLAELHLEMRRLYSLWWEDMGRLLMGGPQEVNCLSVWDNVRDSLNRELELRTPVMKSNPWQRFGRFCGRMFHRIIDLLFRC